MFLVVFQEHHLQRAISAQQVFREKKENMVIPVPEAESNTTYYDRLYKGEVKVPKQLIHIQRESRFTQVYIWNTPAVTRGLYLNQNAYIVLPVLILLLRSLMGERKATLKLS